MYKKYNEGKKPPCIGMTQEYFDLLKKEIEEKEIMNAPFAKVCPKRNAEKQPSLRNSCRRAKSQARSFIHAATTSQTSLLPAAICSS